MNTRMPLARRRLTLALSFWSLPWTRVALGEQDLGDGAHADAADADDVERARYRGASAWSSCPCLGPAARTAATLRDAGARSSARRSRPSAPRRGPQAARRRARPGAFAAAAAARQIRLVARHQPLDLTGQRSGVRSFCSMHQPPPASASCVAFCKLVVVERVRQRHQDRRAADHRQARRRSRRRRGR